MLNFFDRHGRVIGYALSVLIWSLLMWRQAAWRPLTDAEFGCLFAIGGSCQVMAAIVLYWTRASSSPLRIATPGIVVILASLEWILMPNGSHHLFSTTLLLLYVAYLIAAQSRTSTT